MKQRQKQEQEITRMIERRHAKSSNPEVGDKVIHKQKRGDKFTTKFELESSYTVTERQGTKIVAEKLKTQDKKECFVL